MSDDLPRTPSGPESPLPSPPPTSGLQPEPPTAASPAPPAAQAMFCPRCATEYAAGVRFCPGDGAVLRPQGTAGAGREMVGRVVAHAYELRQRLGAGGMGQVFIAEHLKMRRLCALKLLHPSLTVDPEAVLRFAQEAQNASRINHPNVATVYDSGEDEDGAVYIAMEYVEGEPLTALLRREGPLPPARAVDIARQVAQGLAAAHRAGVVHRDLKPDNILLARTLEDADHPKIIDFGIAKAITETGERLTRTGFVVGTPKYMSPEQLTAGEVDARSDIFALGCILFEMLTGGEPWGEGITSSDPSVIYVRRLVDAPAHPRARNPAVSEALDAAVLRALARAPADRFQSAAEFGRALAVASTAPTPDSGPRASEPAPTDARPLQASPAGVRSVGAGSVEVAPIELLRPEAEPQPEAANAGAPGAATPESLPVGASAHDHRWLAARGRNRRTVFLSVGMVAALAVFAVALTVVRERTPPLAPAPDTQPSARGTAGLTSGEPASGGVPLSEPPSTSSPPNRGSPRPGAKAAPRAPTIAGSAEARIESVLSRFVSAMRTRDAARVRAVDPDLDEAQDRWWLLIAGASGGLSARYDLTDAPRVSGDSADVKIEVTFRYAEAGGERVRVWPLRIRLAREGTDWRILTVRTLGDVPP